MNYLPQVFSKTTDFTTSTYRAIISSPALTTLTTTVAALLVADTASAQAAVESTSPEEVYGFFSGVWDV